MALREQQRAEIRSLALSITEEDPNAGPREGELLDSLDDGALPEDIILGELRRGNETNAHNH